MYITILITTQFLHVHKTENILKTIVYPIGMHNVVFYLKVLIHVHLLLKYTQ